MATRYGWTPQQVADLTYEQLAAYLTPDPQPMRFRSMAEAKRYTESKRGG